MEQLKVSGKDLIRSIPGRDLMMMAIMKMIQEGTTWRDVSKDIEVMAWEIHCALDRGDLQ